MKTIGLIGGMSWESSLEYYRNLNELIRKRLGKSHSCELIMYSVDFFDYEQLQHEGKWDKIRDRMINIAKNLQKGGAELLLICTNTMHKLAPEIEKQINIPLLHIGDATAQVIKSQGLNKVGLLGTKFTMNGNFYKNRLKENHNISVIIPDEEEMEIVHQTIYQELISGIIKKDSRKNFIKIIKKLQQRGAEGVILGCTEIPLLIKEKDSPIPVFDTSFIHAQKAIDIALEGKK